MFLSQAIVSSSRASSFEKNSLVARSPDVSDQMIEAICRWCPGRNELASEATSSLSYFFPSEAFVAIGLSRLGETNWRTGTHEVTSHVALLSTQQLAKLDGDPTKIARLLLSSGELIPRNASRKTELPMLEISSPFHELTQFWEPCYQHESAELESLLETRQQVAVLGIQNPIKFLAEFFRAIPVNKRFEYSFATGHRVDKKRPFSMQFFEGSCQEHLRELAHLRIQTLSLGSLRV